MKKTILPIFLLLLLVAGCKKNKNTNVSSRFGYNGSEENLSEARFNMQAVQTGNFTAFAGGWIERIDPLEDTPSYKIDIYNKQTGSWRALTTRNTAYNYGIAAGSNKLIVAGGQINHFTVTDAVEIFDLQGGPSATANLSAARRFVAAGAAGDKFIFAGGQVATEAASNIIDIYDAVQNRWTSTTLSQARYAANVGTAGNRIVIAGGKTTNAFTLSSVMDIYDVQTGNRTTASLSEARINMTVVETATKIFFAGGITITGHQSDNVDVYDVQTGLNTSFKLEQNLSIVKACANGNYVFFTSGRSSATQQAEYLHTYDLRNDRLTKLPLPELRGLFAMASVGEKVVLAGGASGSVYKNNVILFDIPSGKFDNSTFILPNKFGGALAVTTGNKILVAGGVWQAPDPVTGIHFPVNYKRVYYFRWD